MTDDSLKDARLRQVETHVGFENAHDLDAVMATFGGDAQIAGERIYYDRAMVLEQLGVFHDPESATGRVTTALLHPMTMAKVATRMLRDSRGSAAD